MLEKTRGLVLRTVKYGESSLICDIYTEQLGMQTYIVNSVRKAKARISAGLLQLGSLLDLVVYHRPNKEINRIKELQVAQHYQRIPFDFRYGTVALFMAEVTHKCIREEEANPALFQFLFDSFVLLDETGNPNLHLLFLLQLSRFLGFWPRANYSETQPWFDYQEGGFVEDMPAHRYHFNAENSRLLHELQAFTLADIESLRLSASQRRSLLAELLKFYAYYVENFGEPKSYTVLKEVFSN